jgi:formamidopyrimidine-DNA glycosylase
MPELPDIDVYVERLGERIRGTELSDIRLKSPFLLRSFDPPLDAAKGRRVVALRRIGKRIAIGLDAEFWLVIHLMIAGRLTWQVPGAAMRGKHALAAFDFTSGTLLLTEAGSKKRASLYLVCGTDALAAHDPGGLEPLECTRQDFAQRLHRENRTLKRALTSPALFSGIGNAYSDEILHAARLSPTQLTSRLSPDQLDRLFDATVRTLTTWRDRLRQESAGTFPGKVTAFRPEMAVHGKFGQPCPDCGAKVARIRYKRNETNYCPTCQTGGRVLSDRSLARLLKDDWPDRL